MFKEFNVEFQNVEMIGGADNLLENTKVTKVVMSGDNKMSSLDSTFKNCSELDNIQGELNLNDVSDIDNILEGNSLIKSINLKNVNNENISANNSFPYIEEINIGGELYNKKAMQNVIASKEWTFDNITYSGTVGDNVVTKEVNIADDNKTTMKNTLEQKVRGFEIIGQTYENLVVGNGEVTLLDELTLESIDGNKEFVPHIEQEVCVEVIEGETYQNLIEGKGEHKLTDTYSATCTESNNSFKNPPSVIEIPEVWGNTVQGYANVISSKLLYDTINSVNWTDGYGCISDNNYNYIKIKTWGTTNDILSSLNDNSFIQLKANTTYSMQSYNYDTKKAISGYTPSVYSPTAKLLENLNTSNTVKFTTDSTGKVFFFPNNTQAYKQVIKVVEGEVDLSIYSCDEMDLSYIQSVGDLYVDEEGNPILDDEGNEQYKLEIKFSGKNLFCDEILKEVNKIEYNEKTCYIGRGSTHYNSSFQISDKFKANTQYTISFDYENPNNASWGVMHITYSDFQHATTLNFAANAGTNRATITSNEGVSISSIAITSESGKDVYLYNIQLEENSTSTEYEPYQLNKTTILMPQPLRMAGYERYGYNNNGSDLNKPIRDVLYYDTSKKKFFIKKYVMTNYITGNKFIENTIYKQYYTRDIVPPVTINQSLSYVYAIRPFEQSIKKSKLSLIHHNGTTSQSTMLCALKEDYTLEECNALFGNVPLYYGYYKNDTELYYEVIETKILEKPSLETYSPKTYVSTTTGIQPSQMSIVNKQTILSPLSLQANTDYTLQLDSVGKDDKPILVNLGGTETNIQPVNGASTHHKVVVKTPSELTNETLELSGEGVVVNDVMLFEGGSDVIKQEVEYVDGIRSIGKLQDDGTYKIDILTESPILKGLTKGLGTQVTPKRFMIESKNGSWSSAGIVASSTYKKLDTPYTVCMKVISKKLLDNNYAFAGSWLGSTNAFVNYMNDLEVGVVYKKSITPQAEVKEGDSICVFQFTNNAVNGQHMEIEIWLEEDVIKSETQLLIPQQLNKIGDIKDRFYWDEDKGHYCIEQNVSKELEVMASPNIIDLPHLNKKYSLDTYMPTTYLQCVDTTIQPSKLLLESDIVRYKPSALETDTDYTVQFECKERSDKKIKLNLGGSEKEVEAVIGLNHVSITTPNELSKDKLFLSGVGNKVDNVMVVKGEMNQYPEYFEGIANAGELQDDGSYRVRIKSNEGFNVSIISNNPLVKGDKLYWNKSNKRYEIDRDGEIEIPIVNGDVIDLPRLYQRKDTVLTIESGNIKPSSIKVEYLDID